MDYSGRPPLSILQSLVLGGSAASWYLLQTSIELTRRGHRITVVSPPGGTADGAAAAGLEIRTDIDLRGGDPVRLAGSFRSLRRLICSGGFDLVMAHWGADHFWSGLALRRPPADKKPLLVRVRSHDHRAPTVNPLTRILYDRWTDGAVVAAAFQAVPFKQGFNFSDERLVLVGPGVEPERYGGIGRGVWRSRLGIGQDVPLVGLLARLTPIKGHEIFLRAARTVAERHPEVRFIVSGPSLQLELEDIKRMADGIGLGDRLHLAGPAEDVRELIADLDVGVVSSLGSEAISRIALEYMASGLPVVASRVGGLPELIEDGVSGRLVEPGDPDCLARSIVELLDDPETHRAIGTAGRARIEKNYRLSDRVEDLERFLYRLLDLGPRGER